MPRLYVELLDFFKNLINVFNLVFFEGQNEFEKCLPESPSQLLDSLLPNFSILCDFEGPYYRLVFYWLFSFLQHLHTEFIQHSQNFSNFPVELVLEVVFGSMLF